MINLHLWISSKRLLVGIGLVFHLISSSEELNSNYIATTAWDEHQCHRFQDTQSNITSAIWLKYKCIRPSQSVINFYSLLQEGPIPLLPAYKINIDPNWSQRLVELFEARFAFIQSLCESINGFDDKTLYICCSQWWFWWQNTIYLLYLRSSHYNCISMHIYYNMLYNLKAYLIYETQNWTLKMQSNSYDVQSLCKMSKQVIKEFACMYTQSF